MLNTLLMAFALMLVLEGLLPFIAPLAWRRFFLRVAELADGQIRFMGLTLILAGLVLLILVH